MPVEAPQPTPEPWLLDDPEMVALAYHRAAGGNVWAAPVAMARDALADRDALAVQFAACRGRVSRGDVRLLLR